MRSTTRRVAPCSAIHREGGIARRTSSQKLPVATATTRSNRLIFPLYTEDGKRDTDVPLAANVVLVLLRRSKSRKSKTYRQRGKANDSHFNRLAARYP